ncbi:hypothetical protein QBC38DRAFT_518183 [Podospora fimiseda]|uniref:Uncharacterized protein n=1 Tax=Podospora fimiseda TaxID=252190 RepID=A0AAN6YQ18_9PEZI|nr:hypothetical protein QBC38DRAFT_518183 [Podospora fimiseda]
MSDSSIFSEGLLDGFPKGVQWIDGSTCVVSASQMKRRTIERYFDRFYAGQYTLQANEDEYIIKIYAATPTEVSWSDSSSNENSGTGSPENEAVKAADDRVSARSKNDATATDTPAMRSLRALLNVSPATTKPSGDATILRHKTTKVADDQIEDSSDRVPARSKNKATGTDTLAVRSLRALLNVSPATAKPSGDATILRNEKTKAPAIPTTETARRVEILTAETEPARVEELVAEISTMAITSNPGVKVSAGGLMTIEEDSMEEEVVDEETRAAESAKRKGKQKATYYDD